MRSTKIYMLMNRKEGVSAGGIWEELKQDAERHRLMMPFPDRYAVVGVDFRGEAHASYWHARNDSHRQCLENIVKRSAIDSVLNRPIRCVRKRNHGGMHIAVREKPPGVYVWKEFFEKFTKIEATKFVNGFKGDEGRLITCSRAMFDEKKCHFVPGCVGKDITGEAGTRIRAMHCATHPEKGALAELEANG